MQPVAQWVNTKEGVPYLVFWDTGSQVTLTTHKAAQAMKLQAIPSSPLNLEGIGDGHRSKATIRYKVPLVNTGGRVIMVIAYGIEHIMFPLGGGDMTQMRDAFPEVPAGGLVAAECLSFRLNWLPPPHFPQATVFPPIGSWGWGHTRLRAALCILCGTTIS